MRGIRLDGTPDEPDGARRRDIYFIDVEGEASTLFVTSSGESLLIDSGSNNNDGRDRDRVLKVARQVAGLKRIDHALVPHWHEDHYGNHADLSSQIKVGTFWVRGVPEDRRTARSRSAT